MSLPRELLKWLQSLDLTYSVKNVKRDFSNGYLVAEIFSRYFVQDVEMHSFDNGTSLQRKLDNWGQLNKFFTKRGIKIEREIIDDVVHCKNAESPTKLITQIYSILTRREVRGKPAADMAASGLDATSALPPFARPNASTLLSNNIKDSEMLTTLQDKTTAQNRAKSLLDDHAANLRNERSTDPTRFQTNSINGGISNVSYQNMLRGPPKTVSEAVETAPVRFQEVKVKTVDRKIAQIRASRDPINGGISFTGSSPASVAAGPGGGGGGGPAMPPPAPVTDVMQLLSDRVLTEPALLQGAQAAADSAFLVFLRALPDTDEGAAAAFFNAACVEADKLSAACAESPKQAWQLFNVLLQALTAASGMEAVFTAIASLLCAVGFALVASDAKLAQSLIHDFGLRLLLPMLSTLQQPQLKDLLSVLYAWSPETPEAHIDTIRWLQESLADQKSFLNALTVLIELEKGFSDELLDLYVYYCVIALGMPSSRLRAAALGMLPTVCQVNYQLVLQMQPRLTMLVEEPWWEVSAGLGKICAMLLSIPEAAAAEEGASLLDVLLKVLGSRSPMVLRVVLPAAAPLLASQPAVGAAFAAALVELGPKERAQMLQGAADWPALEVATAVLALASEQKLEHLLSAHAEVLVAVMSQPLAGAERDGWQSWLKTYKDYLYVGLCDEDLCKLIADVLLRLFGVLSELAIPTFSTLFSSLRIIAAPDSHPACQASADSLLVTLFQMGEPFAGAIAKLVGNFEPPMRTAMSQAVKLVEGA